MTTTARVPAPTNTATALLDAWERAESLALFGSASPEPYPGAWRERANALRDGWVVQLVREGRAELSNE